MVVPNICRSSVWSLFQVALLVTNFDVVPTLLKTLHIAVYTLFTQWPKTNIIRPYLITDSFTRVGGMLKENNSFARQMRSFQTILIHKYLYSAITLKLEGYFMHQ